MRPGNAEGNIKSRRWRTVMLNFLFNLVISMITGTPYGGPDRWK
jgi:hypothetical protein